MILMIDINTVFNELSPIPRFYTKEKSSNWVTGKLTQVKVNSMNYFYPLFKVL